MQTKFDTSVKSVHILKMKVFLQLGRDYVQAVTQYYEQACSQYPD